MGRGLFVLRSRRSMCNEVIARPAPPLAPSPAVSAGPRYVGNRLAVAAVAVSLAAALAGCATPKRREVNTVGLNRDTPSATFEYLRSMVAAEQPEAEWKVFSPEFKRRLSQQAGRTVDVADYVQARSTFATNKRKEIALLVEATVVREQAQSDRTATVEIRSQDRQARPRFVKLTTWELTLKGEGEPVAEFVPSPADLVTISPTGQVEMKIAPSEGTASFLKDVTPDRIRSLRVTELWYLDDFGGVESAVVGGLRGGAAPPKAAAPGQPPLPPPPAPGDDPNLRPAPAPTAGSPDGAPVGSPDGPPPPPSPAVPAGSPDGVGSPDGR